MFDTVLVPTDGSPGSERALEHGLALADRYRSTVHALYVLDDSGLPASFSQLPEAADLQTTLETAGREALDCAESRARELGVDIATECRTGDPVTEILAYTEEIDADVLVLCSHHRGRLRRFLHTSVVEGVIRGVSIPVLTVQADDVERTTDYRTVLLATDGREGAVEATKYALDIASTYDAALHAMYVLDRQLLRSSALRSYLEDQAERALRDVTETAARRGVGVVTERREGTPHDAITTYAEQNGMDLLVLGTSNRPELDRFFVGSVATSVLRSSSRPLLIVPPETHSA